MKRELFKNNQQAALLGLSIESLEILEQAWFELGYDGIPELSDPTTAAEDTMTTLRVAWIQYAKNKGYEGLNKSAIQYFWRAVKFQEDPRDFSEHFLK